MSRCPARSRGFTLLEVLVALAIFAIVAAVVLTAAGRSVNNAGRLEALTLASWIADNRLTELQLQQPAPNVGREDTRLAFGGRQWQTLSEVE
ncbi:type II secretion system minor pseudopilin GspI, partial [Stutzerimonas stutzeri]|uniref:type II secretion system minor pseudopilin GspI n=1 Tax=Stutzerimonas stutzeri TaxID=316 RepID=UPI00035FC337